MTAKDEHLALTSGIGLAGMAVTNFWSYSQEAFKVFKEEIIDCIVKPNKKTAVHWYLSFFQDISEEIHQIKNNLDMEYAFNVMRNVLDEVNLRPNLQVPDFEGCADECGHFDCDCSEVIDKWINYINENNHEIDELIIHSAFQFIFQDRKFLHDFHLELSHLIEEEMGMIIENYPEYVTNKRRFKRQYFPEWLKTGVFYRDKGTCVICRCDLSNLIRIQNKINIDHIIPLNVYGSNDASNMQLLCGKCNTTKGDRTTETSSVNVPFWNL
ncbi:HNH endonuclease [Fictibacillus sp. WQ 8-8]|uniref:HNH endonuclease n=1 Tax=Fictibacillus sp. WQ 8-8 TaxID=2938788 RepID=UPI00210AF2D4|nr:HNH endonuclease signature motif containing protein [Fictibacillus sp. WQ 8-8]MCQ6265592.1 HNH endonuclease [Fictibacillus sp. WQ 8-8]